MDTRMAAERWRNFIGILVKQAANIPAYLLYFPIHTTALNSISYTMLGSS